MFVASILFLVVSRLRWEERTGEGQAGSGEKGGEEEPRKWYQEQKQAKFVSKPLSFCRIVLLFREKVVDFWGKCAAAFGESESFAQKGACFSWIGRNPSVVRLEI